MPLRLPDGVPVVLGLRWAAHDDSRYEGSFGVLAALSGQILRRSTTRQARYRLTAAGGLLVPYMPLANYQQDEPHVAMEGLASF